MSTIHPLTKEVRARRKGKDIEQFELRVGNDDLHFVTDFIRGSAFYIEDLEERIGEDLNDFWQQREHALRVLTDWMMQSMPAPMIESKAA
jgi:hypothetical protein